MGAGNIFLIVMFLLIFYLLYAIGGWLYRHSGIFRFLANILGAVLGISLIKDAKRYFDED